MLQRPKAMEGLTYSVETPLGTAYITVNHDEEQEPREVFVNQGKAGSDIAPLSEAIGKLASHRPAGAVADAAQRAAGGDHAAAARHRR